MKLALFLITALFTLSSLSAQEFSEQILSPGRIDRTEILDVDNDGDLDIVASYIDFFPFGELPLYRNNGDGTFNQEVLFESDENYIPEQIVAANFDGDTSDLELLFYANFVSSNEGKLVVGKLVGEELQTTDIIISENFAPKALITSGDFDGDGDTDIGLAGPFTNRIGWLENNGDFNFILHETDVFNGPIRIASADLDGDEQDELIVTRTATFSDNMVYYNLSTEPSEPLTISDDYQTATGIITTDFNDDTFIDLITCNQPTGTIAEIVFWQNDGDITAPTFTPLNVINPSLLGEMEDLAYADMDNDGDMDLIVTGADDKIIYLENDVNISGEYIETIISERAARLGMNLADLDSDGDLDFTVGSEDNPFLWFRNDILSSTLDLHESNIEPLRIYPTISSDQISLDTDISVFDNKPFDYYIFNTAGSLVQKGQLQGVLSVIDISHLISGGYKVLVSYKDGTRMGSFLKM